MLYQDAFLSRLEAGLRSLLPDWGLPADAPLALLTVSENATYVAEDAAAGRRVILRVHRPGYRTVPEIESELAWIAALRDDEVVATPAIVPALDGRLVLSFDDAGQERHAVAFAHMSGREPDASDDLVPWFMRLGRINARLHEHSRRWTRPAGFTRKAWTCDTMIGPNAYWGDWRAALGLQPDGKAVLERLETWLARWLAEYGMGPERYGLVHSDLRLANLLVDGDRLGVIDFDDCGFGWFGFDFAAAVSFHEHLPFIPDVKQAWIEGYREAAPLAAADEAALDVFILLRRLQLTAWIASHAETPTALAMGAPYTDGTVHLADAFLTAQGQA